MSLREKLGTPSDQPFPPVIIGAGLNKNFRHPDKLRLYAKAAKAAGGAVVIGSITRFKRSGNQGECLQYETNGVTVNTWGMPNDGVDAMPASPPHDNLIVSIAGETIEEYIDLYNRRWSWGLGVELNFGCPNTGSGNRIFSFVPDAMAEVLDHIHNRVSNRSLQDRRQLVGVKVSPYSDPYDLAEVARMFCQFPTIDYVATCNTFPNGRAYDPTTGKLAIRNPSTSDMGGVGGRALTEISLGQFKQFRKIFDSADSPIELVRCGGIFDGIDLWVSEKDGCDGVQVVSAVDENFHRIYHMMQEYEGMDYSYPSSAQ